MRIRVHSKGKFYLIECPAGSRVVRCDAKSASSLAGDRDVLVVPFNCQEISIPSDAPELLPLLAESGRCGLSLIGEPVPDVELDGAKCPTCKDDDQNWPSLTETSRLAHCDRCGCDFYLNSPR